MLRVDFYFISQPGPQAQLDFACRLLEKAYLQNHQIYVHCPSPEHAQLLNSHLWTFREDSFIPHELVTPQQAPSSAIQLGSGSALPQHGDILLNLHPEIPSFHSQFKRILEIISPEAQQQAWAREHQAFYSSQSYTLNTHQLTT